MKTEIYDKKGETPYIVIEPVTIEGNCVHFSYFGTYYHIPLNCIKCIKSDEERGVIYYS